MRLADAQKLTDLYRNLLDTNTPTWRFDGPKGYALHVGNAWLTSATAARSALSKLATAHVLEVQRQRRQSPRTTDKG